MKEKNLMIKVKTEILRTQDEKIIKSEKVFKINLRRFMDLNIYANETIGKIKEISFNCKSMEN